MTELRAPFPYYGSKRAAASLIEQLMGPINNLVIPFAGSLGELLGRSGPAKVETVNDLDGLIVNAWRAMKYSAEQMADLCNHPVHEVTLHAVHDMLLAKADDLTERLSANEKEHDVELAAWWVWGASCWLGAGWCREPAKKLPRVGGPGSGAGRPDLGRGVARRQIPLLRGASSDGVGYGCGINTGANRGALLELFRALMDRLQFVRITCGDWQRAVTRAITTSHGITGVPLDPPYCQTRRRIKYRKDSQAVAAESRAWAIENGSDPLFRITLAGKDDEHDETLEHGWTKVKWRKDGESIWASPHCRRLRGQIEMFHVDSL